MENQLCSMCYREDAPIISQPEETDGILEELTDSFEVARNSFRGNRFCADCCKLLALTHQISIKARLRKEAEEQVKPVKPERSPSVEQPKPKPSLAKRMRLAQQAAREREQELPVGCSKSRENSYVKVKVELGSVSESKSDETEHSAASDDCCMNSGARSCSLKERFLVSS